jgi:hypothetical protein
MTEDPIIIRMNIAHYGALLKLDLDDDKRSIVERLLAEAKRDLAVAVSLKQLQERRAEERDGATPVCEELRGV